MSVDYNYIPSEFERLEKSIDRSMDYKISYLEERFDKIEGTIYDSHEKTTLGIEWIKKELSAPFTKWEWLTLFFWWIWWNVLIAWLLDIKWFLNGATYIGTAILVLSLIIWIYLFCRKL